MLFSRRNLTAALLFSVLALTTAVESQAGSHGPEEDIRPKIINAAPVQPTWSEEPRFKEVGVDNLADAEVVDDAPPRFASTRTEHAAASGCQCTPQGCNCPGDSAAEPPIPSEEQVAEQRQGQMKAALADIKDEIVMTAHQIKDEKKWVHEVYKIVEEYNKKIKRVAGNVKYLQKKIQKLLLKKKQIENMILQNKLTAKLKEATKDLRVLNNALENVGTKKQKFEQSKSEVKNTIAAIKQQIEKLQSGGEEQE